MDATKEALALNDQQRQAILVLDLVERSRADLKKAREEFTSKCLDIEFSLDVTASIAKKQLAA